MRTTQECITYYVSDNPRAIRSLQTFIQDLPVAKQLSVYLNELMEEKQLTAPEVYHRAEIDRQTYNRLIQYKHPKRASKRTLLQTAIGLKVTQSEAELLLATCGFTFELTSSEDLAYLFCIQNGIYSMIAVNDVQDMLSERTSYGRSI